jgi:hypothetical protein
MKRWCVGGGLYCIVKFRAVLYRSMTKTTSISYELFAYSNYMNYIIMSRTIIIMSRIIIIMNRIIYI